MLSSLRQKDRNFRMRNKTKIWRINIAFVCLVIRVLCIHRGRALARPQHEDENLLGIANAIFPRVGVRGLCVRVSPWLHACPVSLPFFGRLCRSLTPFLWIFFRSLLWDGEMEGSLAPLNIPFPSLLWDEKFKSWNSERKTKSKSEDCFCLHSHRSPLHTSGESISTSIAQRLKAVWNCFSFFSF